MFESAFSFSYAKDVAPSNAMPVSSSFKPPTPPTAQDEVDDITSFPLGSFSSMGGSNGGSFNAGSGGNNGFSPSGASLFGASPSAFGLPQTTSAGAYTASPPTFDDSLFLNTLTGASPGALSNPPSSASASGSSAHVTTPPDTNDLFAAYRDPNFGVPTLTSLNDFDTLFGNGSGLDDPLAQFIASPSPPLLTSATSAPLKLDELPCPYGPKTKEGKFEFDVDGLCSEYVALVLCSPATGKKLTIALCAHRMKLKATCQEAARQALRSAMKEDADSVAAAYPGQL